MTKALLVFESVLSEAYERWIFKELSKVGLSAADCSQIHIVPKELGYEDKLTAAMISENLPAFYKKLREASARVVLVFGGPATKAVLGRSDRLEFLRGYVWEPADLSVVSWKETGVIGAYLRDNKKKGIKAGDDKLGKVLKSQLVELPDRSKVICTFSPQFLVKNGFKPLAAFAADLRRAKTMADGFMFLRDDQIFDAERNFLTEPKWDWIPQDDMFAFDIEVRATPTGYSRDPELISLSDGVVTMCLPWNEQTRDYCKHYLGNAKYTKWAHNSIFDTARLRDAGCTVIDPIFDSMLAAQLLTPDLGKALGKVASIYLHLKEWKSKSDSDPMFYSAKDAFVTVLLARELDKKLKKLGMHHLFTNICVALPVLLDMNERGIKVDLSRAAIWAQELKDKLTDLSEKWIQMTAPIAAAHSEKGVSPGSTRQLQKMFYQWFGCAPRRNRSDSVTLDAEALFDLKTIYPEHAELVTLLLEYREVSKQYGTYAKVLAGLFNDDADRVHPEYISGGMEGASAPGRKGHATTGRLGVSRPNIQNQTPEARRMYIPDSPDHCFIELDFSQAELRVIAALSGDAELTAALAGGDIHSQTATRLGVPRKLAKNAIYASCYLGGPKTIQSMLKKEGIIVGVPEIKKVQALLRRLYARMFAWQTTVVEEMLGQGYLINPFGRVRFFYGKDKDGPEAADFNPQSSVADITWYLLPELQERAGEFGGRVVSQVHDSFLFCVPKDQVERATRVFTDIMQREFVQVAPGFHIPVDAKVGKPGQSWGELEKEVHV
jgi:DNA polymerase I-like protein with 3'-5' exonuclease and polymerase domains